MKRIIITAAAVAASVAAFATPEAAQAQNCTTPVTYCVAQATDTVVDTVTYYYDWTITTLQDGPNINSYCKLIWPDGCSVPMP
jgi:D-arabinose 1-dehydrogenase-like Zn-dependent alcohol dehydrogenase